MICGLLPADGGEIRIAGMPMTTTTLEPKKVIGLVEATDEEKAKARRTATLTSRVNFLLSFPMLLCMSGSAHGLPY